MVNLSLSPRKEDSLNVSLFHHGLGADPVPRRGVVQKDVGYGADELSVLDDRAAGKALDDAAG